MNPNDTDYVELGNQFVNQMATQGRTTGKQHYGLKYGVKWLLNNPDFPPHLHYSFEEIITKIYSLQSNVIVVDVGTNWLDKEIQKFIRLADQVLLCVEPDLIKNQAIQSQPMQKEILESLQAPELIGKFETVLMKHVHNIDMKNVRQHLPKVPISEIPYIHYMDYIQALYNQRLIYELAEYRSDLSAALSPIIQRSVPFTTTKGNHGGLKNKLLLGIKGKIFNN